jgi:hypothetical protein
MHVEVLKNKVQETLTRFEVLILFRNKSDLADQRLKTVEELTDLFHLKWQQFFTSNHHFWVSGVHLPSSKALLLVCKIWLVKDRIRGHSLDIILGFAKVSQISNFSDGRV